MPPSLTIGIPTFGREAVLIDTVRQCLAIAPSGAEIIVADQTPDHEPAVARQLQDWHGQHRITWLKLARPSLTAARNAILAAMTAQVVVFLDDDVILPPGLFQRHLDRYQDPAVDAVAGEVYHCLHPDQPPPLDHPDRGAPPHFSLRMAPGPTSEMVGAHHSVRRAAALAARGYDENIIGPAYSEDGDMALRLVDAGRHIVFDPSAWVIHLRTPSGGCRIPGSRSWPEWTKSANFILYWLRHRHHSAGARTFLRGSLRAGPLRRENVLRPWRWPLAWCAWFRAFAYAFKRRRRVASPWA